MGDASMGTRDAETWTVRGIPTACAVTRCPPPWLACRRPGQARPPSACAVDDRQPPDGRHRGRGGHARPPRVPPPAATRARRPWLRVGGRPVRAGDPAASAPTRGLLHHVLIDGGCIVKEQPRADDSFGTIAATGNPITLQAMTFVRLLDDTIVENHARRDLLGMVHHRGGSSMVQPTAQAGA